MKQSAVLFTSLILLGAAFMLPSTGASLAWTIQTVDDINNARVGFIALDSNNDLHIAYLRSTGGHLNGEVYLMYASWNGNSWDIQEVATDYSPEGLVIDSSNNPHILCSSVGVLGLTYASWNGTEWNLESIDPDGRTGSVALDSLGNPHIAYNARDGAEKYAVSTGAGWSIHTIALESIDHAKSTNDDLGLPLIALDSSNNSHIIYQKNVQDYNLQQNTAESAIEYALWNISTREWNYESVVSNATLESMALDSKGYPHFTYHKGIVSGALCYASWNGTTWTTQIIDNLTPFSPSCLAIDANNRPHIIYLSNTGNLTYVRSTDNNSWDIQTDSAITGLSINSMTLDTYGNPYICYSRGIPFTGPYELLYATVTENTQVPATTSNDGANTLHSTGLLIAIPLIALAVLVIVLMFRRAKQKDGKARFSLFLSHP